MLLRNTDTLISQWYPQPFTLFLFIFRTVKYLVKCIKYCQPKEGHIMVEAVRGSLDYMHEEGFCKDITI